MAEKNKLLDLDYHQIICLLCDDMIIEGGHYSLGEQIDPVAAWTWDRAVELYAYAFRQGRKNIALALLVDDFSVDVKIRQENRTRYRLPENFRKSLEVHGLGEEVVRVVWEVQLRNRAHGDLRRRLKPLVAIEDGGYYVNCNDNTRRQLTNGTTPVCNLIMARHFLEKDSEFTLSLNFYDMKWECASTGGVVVSRRIYNTKITVYNVYVSMARSIAFVGYHEGLPAQKRHIDPGTALMS